MGLTMKVVLCIPTIIKPYQCLLDSIEKSIPVLEKANIDHYMVTEVGSPYISHARSKLLRKALDAGAEIIIFLDHDISFDPGDLLKLIQTDGDVVAGTYRFKKEGVEEYMGAIMTDDDGYPLVREDGCIKSHSIPAGFLKITEPAVLRFMEGYPNLCYGKKYCLSVDLFNHGAHNGVWYGEDYAFSRNWRALGQDIWLIPDMNINHHAGDTIFYGNYHKFLLRQPGGKNGPALRNVI